MNKGRDRVTGWETRGLSEGDDCDNVWEVVDSAWMSVGVGCVGYLFEMPWDEWCIVSVVLTNVV